jgi:hypothetical protein
VGRELVTLVVQHAEAKSGKSVTVSVLTSDVPRGTPHWYVGADALVCPAERSSAASQMPPTRSAPEWYAQKIRTSPLQKRAGPELNGQISVYCWPMIFPLMSMLSSTTMLEPASGPPSWTRWMLFTLLPAGMAGTVCAGLAGSKRKRFHPATGAG